MALFASLMDLDSEAGGIPTAALSSIANATKLRALSRCSDEALSYVRARYSEPVQAVVETPEFVPATGSTGTGEVTAARTAGASITQAYGVMMEVLTTGAIGVATARVSTDSGIRWGASFTIPDGDVALSIGVTLTFSDDDGGGFFDGDIYRIPVAFGALTAKVLALATYTLLVGRGYDPDGAGGDMIGRQYKRAYEWLKGVRDNQIDPGLTDGTAGVEEGGFVFFPTTVGQGDRGWSKVLGRDTIRVGPTGASWPDV